MINGVDRCVDVMSIQTHPQGDLGVNPRTIGVFSEYLFRRFEILLVVRPEVGNFREREPIDSKAGSQLFSEPPEYGFLRRFLGEPMFEGVGAGTPFGDMTELPFLPSLLFFQKVPTDVHQRETIRGKSA